MRSAHVHRLSMAHPGDLSELERLIAAGTIRAADIVAVIGKTEGNGGVNDFTRILADQAFRRILLKQIGRAHV